jgi:hypothetical protein
MTHFQSPKLTPQSSYTHSQAKATLRHSYATGMVRRFLPSHAGTHIGVAFYSGNRDPDFTLACEIHADAASRHLQGALKKQVQAPLGESNSNLLFSLARRRCLRYLSSRISRCVSRSSSQVWMLKWRDTGKRAEKRSYRYTQAILLVRTSLSSWHYPRQEYIGSYRQHCETESNQFSVPTYRINRSSGS